MNIFSLGFVLLIVLASGGIAYAADILGKKLGKKRMSLRVGRVNVRPKHVASLGTVGMGMAVSLLTILLVAAASSDARTWLARGQELIVDLRRLEGDVKAQQGQLEALKRQGSLYEARVREGQQKVGQAQAKVASLQKLIDKRTQELDERSTDLAVARRDLEKTRDELALIRRDLPLAQENARKAQEQYVAAKGRLESARADLVAVNRDLKAAQVAKLVAQTNARVARNNENETAKKSLETYKKNVELTNKTLELEADVKRREKDVETLQNQAIALDEQRRETEGKLADAKAQYALVAAQLDEAGTLLAELRTVAQGQQSFLSGPVFTSRTQEMTFRRGEELARVVVPRGADAEAAADALEELLKAARAEAADRGAKAHKTGDQTFDVADVFDRQDPKTRAKVSGDALKRAVVRGVQGLREEGVLVATSSLNAFAGESVSLEIDVKPNPVVYRRNSLVADARIDGTLDEDKILEQLSEFLRSRVREQATQSRMIPRAGSDAPFGEVSAFEMMNVVRDVKRMGRAVRVQALAGADTRAADPLRLEFRVR